MLEEASAEVDLVLKFRKPCPLRAQARTTVNLKSLGPGEQMSCRSGRSIGVATLRGAAVGVGPKQRLWLTLW